MRLSPDLREQLIHRRTLGFDVIGTLTDPRGTMESEGIVLTQKYSASFGLKAPDDWGEFFDKWRAQYVRDMDNARQGASYAQLDTLFRRALDSLLKQYGLDGLPEEEKAKLNGIWGRAKKWPDVLPGFDKLKRAYNLVPISNGNDALLSMVNLPFHAIFGAQTFKAYKNPEFYRRVSEHIGFSPDNLTMIASHAGDLRDAAEAGWGNLFYVVRPFEYGPQAVRPVSSSDLPEGTKIVYGINEIADALDV